MTVWRVLSSLLVTLLFGVTAGLSQAADMSARQVTELLFGATHLKPPDLSRRDLSGLDLSGLDFKNANLAGSDLYGADLTGANLAATNLQGVRLDRATITGAEFSSANLEQARILRPTVFTGLEPVRREAPRFAGARMSGAIIIGWLDGADFRWADLSRVVFGARSERGKSTDAAYASMTGCDFSEATLVEASLVGANLQYAKFARANLMGADLRGANLTRVDFTGANLAGADVTDANLDEADFTGAEGFASVVGLAHARNADRAIRPQ